MPNYIETCEHAARAAGEILLDWMGRFAVREKGPADLVTEADFASQVELRRILLGAYPEHGFLGEEGGDPEEARKPLRWIVDPLDGTMNYVHGVPDYAVSVALVEDGTPIVGTIFNPSTGECFCSERGAGAFLNGKRLAVAETTELSQALVAASLPPRVRREAPELRQLINVALECQGLRRTGSAALNLAYVAAGRYDAYWSTTTHAWDIAAGVLMVREAGGIATDVRGAAIDLENPTFLVAATGPLHSAVLQQLAKP